MKLALLVYIASIVNGVGVFLCVASLVALIIYFLVLAILHFSDYGVKSYSWDSDEEVEKQKNVIKVYTRYWKLAAIALPIMFLVGSLIPSERTLYLMAGAYATEQIATNDRVQKIGSDVLEVIESKLDKMKEDK